MGAAEQFRCLSQLELRTNNNLASLKGDEAKGLE